MAISFPERFNPRSFKPPTFTLNPADLRTLDPATLDPRRYQGAFGLARFGATAGLHIASWAGANTVRYATDLVHDISAGEPITEIVDVRMESVRSTLWRFLHLDTLSQPVTAASASVAPNSAPVRRPRNPATLRDLRKQGDDLLLQLSDPATPRSEHPAFARMLSELVPDEARILRFLALAGPQPAIDVRTKTPLGVGSELLASGISLVAEMAGSTYPERNQQYLANLTRLGMIQYSEERVEDPRRYSFIEAQPVAAAAMGLAKRAHTVYRSILITQFGQQFCEVCFTLDGYDAGGWVRDVR